MNILSIGNSFSQDAQKWLHSISVANGNSFETYNLFIGGCSLETHWNCIKNNLSRFELFIHSFIQPFDTHALSSYCVLATIS